MDTGLLLARLIIGLALAAHGSQKLFGWFGGYGIKGTGGWMESLGYKPGAAFALAAGLGELGGGLLMALGLLGAIGPALIVMVMLVAIFSVHAKNGFWASNNGWELNAMIVAGAIALAFSGPGAYSLDSALGIVLFTAAKSIWLVLAAAVILAILNLLVRRPAPAAPPAS